MRLTLCLAAAMATPLPVAAETLVVHALKRYPSGLNRWGFPNLTCCDSSFAPREGGGGNGAF